MKLEDRIQNIKKLLSYCPKSTEDVMLSDDILCKFFWRFFSSKPERFKTPAFEGSTRVQINLLGNTYGKNITFLEVAVRL